MEKQTSRPLLNTIERSTLTSPSLFLVGFGCVLIAIFLTIEGRLIASALPLGVGCALLSISVGVHQEKAGETTKLLFILPIRRPSVGDIGATVLTLALMLVTLLGIDAAALRVGFSLVSTSGIAPSTTELVGTALLMFFVVGPVEETMFRYALQDQLLLGTPPRRIIIASVAFALTHPRFYIGADPVFAAVHLTLAGMLGAILGIAYEWRGNLLVPILAHAAYNTIIIALPLL